ncbi:zinc finger X-chromosomal protein-like [Calliopsis andreniformis]|uniref:zinc finger X-chromosomal protein-like n=1 Tax=Calliopsis andreniformis TaxID=337506 RepID=UPI003FCE8D95
MVRISARKYLCPNCGSSFAHRNTQKRHVRYECYQGPSFKCPSCEYRTRRSSDVYRHIRRKHEGTTVRVIHIDSCKN